MANNSINISLKDTFESMVLTGQVGESIWTGVISADFVNDALVEDEVIRQRLKELIEELEENIKNIRTISKTTLQATGTYYKVRELSQKIYEIVAGGKVDVELYLIILIKQFDEMKEENPTEFARINSACKNQMEQNRKTILSQNAVFAYPTYVGETKSYSFEIVLIKEQEGRVKKKGGKEKILSFVRTVYGKELPEEKEVGILDEICKKLLIPDMLEAAHSQSVQSVLNEAFFRNYLLRLGFTRSEIEDCDIKKLTELAKDLQNTTDENNNIFAQTFTDMLLDHIDYISIDKLVIAFLYRSLEDYNRSAQLSFDFEEIFSESRDLHELYKRVVNAKFLSNTSMSVITREGMKTLTLRDMKKKEREFIDGIYLTPDILDAMKNMLFLKRSNLANCDSRIVDALNYSNFDMEVISLVDFSNLERFLELGKVNKMFIDRLVRNCSLDIYTTLQERDDDETFKLIEFPSTIELVKFLYKKKYITEKDLFEYYTLNEITIEDLELLEKEVDNKEEFRNGIKSQIDDFDFVSRYKEYVKAKNEYEEVLKNEKPEIEFFKNKLEARRKEKDRMLMLYKKYKTLTDKTEFLEDALLYFCLENEENIVIEALREMYKDSVITLEDIEYLDSSYLQVIIMDNLFAKGELNLDDTEKIKNSISAEALKNIILNIVRNPNITRSQKFALIMNVYNTGTKEESEISEELLEELRLAYDGTDFGNNGTAQPTQKKKITTQLSTQNNNKSKSNVEWVYPKYVKWKFLKAIDKDAEVKLYAGGYVEVYSKKLDARIIERYFETDKSGDDFAIDAYGHATFILSDADYRANQGDLVSQRVCKNTINGKKQVSIEEYMSREALVRIVDTKDRIKHNTHSQTKNWMREMAKYFNIDLDTDLSLVQDSRYTKEELEALRDVIRTYENAYIDRNAER